MFKSLGPMSVKLPFCTAQLGSYTHTLNFTTMEERRVREDLITTFGFLKHSDVDIEQFFKRYRDRTTRGHNVRK